MASSGLRWRRGEGARNRRRRPPEGDWLGTPFLTFERRGPFGVVTLDRPEARNAMTPAMYFGIGYAVNLVAADDGLAGLMITGTGDVFAPGGDLAGGGGDDWMDFSSLPIEALLPFDTLRTSRKPVVSAVNGLPQGGGMVSSLRAPEAVEGFLAFKERRSPQWVHPALRVDGRL